VLIFNINIDKLTYFALRQIISNSINENKKIVITYATVATLNFIMNNLSFAKLLSKFDVIHPDGIGIYLASKFLYGKNGLQIRMTGSDFYPLLMHDIEKNNWTTYFLGDTAETIKILKRKTRQLNIVGLHKGFFENKEKIIASFTNIKPDILIVGMGQFKQEEWVIENRYRVNAKVIICVGEGIKVFAGNKKRGPKIMQILGLEWTIRLANNPRKYWKRYLVGIPLFIFRIIKLKIKN
jgi:N-acetylglucosaminyldiphosphoundecaprenol N-acetyl-beta-D-mannosaminyltransferase